MTKRFLISGSIVDVDADKQTIEDVTPTQLNSYVKGLSKDDELEIAITSYGGSVTAGLAMVNIIRQLQRDGIKTKAHVIGIAASMASVIACACDVLEIDDNAFLMVHLPWTVTQGNASDLRKQADVLDRYRDALVSIYRSKFDMTDDEIVKMLEAETWIIGSDCKSYSLKANVIETSEPMRIAACLNCDMPKFTNVPKNLMEKLAVDKKLKNEEEIEEKEKEEKETEEANEDEEEAKEDDKSEEVNEEEKKEEVTEEKPVEEKDEDESESESDDEEDEQKTVEEKMITKAECEKRVSGMQSTMAKQMDTMRKRYEAKISDFEIKAKAMNEELETVKAESISLKSSLEKTENELSKTISAFEEKKSALASLNASVNRPNLSDENKPWKNLHGEALLRWCRENQTR